MQRRRGRRGQVGHHDGPAACRPGGPQAVGAVLQHQAAAGRGVYDGSRRQKDIRRRLGPGHFGAKDHGRKQLRHPGLLQVCQGGGPRRGRGQHRGDAPVPQSVEQRAQAGLDRHAVPLHPIGSVLQPQGVGFVIVISRDAAVEQAAAGIDAGAAHGGHHLGRDVDAQFPGRRLPACLPDALGVKHQAVHIP